jgi:hypothetical protein
MKSSKSVFLVLSIVTLFPVAAAYAAHIDMTDPKRALGREDDVRVDAQLTQDTVSAGSPISVTYQVQNLSAEPVAIAEKICEVSYDSDSRTITMSIGSEVPKEGAMPKLVTLAPGEKKTFTIGRVLHAAVSSMRTPFSVTPRFVQIKVNVLRGLSALRSLFDRQARSTTPVTLDDREFETWLEHNDAIFLNAIPVQYDAAPRSGVADASQQSAPAKY